MHIGKMARDPGFIVRTDSSSSAAIERDPDGIAHCILIAFTGEIIVSTFPSIFDAVRQDLPGDELNIISDYGGASLYANLNDLAAAYRHFHRNGIRIFRSVVIDKDRGRPLFQNFARAVAETNGLRVEFTTVRDREAAYATMRAMLGRQPPALADQDCPAPGHRDLLHGLGRRMEQVSASVDLEFEPGGLPDSYMVHVTGRYDSSDVEKLFASLGPNIADHTLNLICDERQAVMAIDPALLPAMYDRILALGIRRYNLVVVNGDPARDEGLRHAQAVARSRGLEARFVQAAFAERAVAQMRALLTGMEP